MPLKLGERIWLAFFATLTAASCVALGIVITVWCMRTVRGAELAPMIMCGANMCDVRGAYVGDGPIDKFGTYSLKYYERRWKRMCKTGARYDAMREANDMGRPQPC